MISLLSVVLAILLFLTAVIIHLNCCRLSPDKNLKARLFVAIALQLLVLFFIIALLFHLTLVLTATAIYILLIPGYLIFYVSTQLVSPSKKILRLVDESKECHYEDILKGLEKEDLIISRMDELVASGCVRRDQDRFYLSAQGLLIARFLNAYQLLLGRKIGG